MGDDWFRRKTWTPNDKAAFLARLGRSRSRFHKAQYARIQAYELLTTRTPQACTAALELLDMILANWRENAQLASVYHHRAECHTGLGDLPQAILDYQEVFRTQRANPSELTMAHLDFGWLVATTPLPAHYDEAISLLGEFRHNQFPLDHYRSNAIHALIFELRGEVAKARHHAHLALQASAAGHSGLRYHADVGLVKSPDPKIHRRLQLLAD